MSSEALLSNIIPFAGSGLLGFEKDIEVDINHRWLGWDVLYWCSTIAKGVPLGLTTLKGVVFRTTIQLWTSQEQSKTRA